MYLEKDFVSHNNLKLRVYDIVPSVLNDFNDNLLINISQFCTYTQTQKNLRTLKGYQLASF